MVKQEIIDPEPQKANPCPYVKCAGKSTRLGLLIMGGDRWVYCRGCGCSGPIAHSEIEAVELWNERIPPPPPRAIHLPRLVLLFVFLALLAGCTSEPMKPSKVFIAIENRTDEPVYGLLATGSPFFSPTLTLEPHATSEYWIYREFVPGRIKLIILQPKSQSRGGDK